MFVCVDCVCQQLNNSLEKQFFDIHDLTDEFTADDNFIHLGKLKKLDLFQNSFSEAGTAAISLMIQVQSPLICLFVCSLSNSLEFVCIGIELLCSVFFFAHLLADCG